LETVLRPREVIGVDAGNATLRSVVEQMRPVWKVADCQVVQALGGTAGDPSAEGRADYLMSRLATLVQGEAHFLPTPARVAEGTAEVLVQDPHVRETMAWFERITLALVGVNTAEPSSWSGGGSVLSSTNAVQSREAQEAVGNVCLRFYDVHGQEVKEPGDVRVFGLKATRLKGIHRVVGIAGGKSKRQALLGAVRGRWINVLITDQFSAEALLRT
jgi:DNA-binding transcriptional regulator LsrR (DeoR family)